MSHLVFVCTTGPGVQALEYAVERGHEVTLITSADYRFLASAADHERTAALVTRTIDVDDLGKTGEIARHLLDLDPPPDAVFTTVHFTASYAAELARAVRARGTDPEAIHAARDKALCREAVRAAGIPDVRSAVVRNVDQAHEAMADIGYPAIIKPANGAGKVATTLVRDGGDVDAHFATQRDQVRSGLAVDLDDRFLVEELAVGRLYSVEVAAAGGRLTPLAVVRRKTGRDNPLLELGSTVPCGLDGDLLDSANRLATDVCRALGLDLGIFHVEMIMTERGPRLVEVNPRIAGGAIPDLVRAATGHNLFHTLVDLHAGAPAPAEPLTATSTASHSFLAASTSCTTRSDIPDDWFERFRPRIHSGWSDIRPGMRMQTAGTNLDVRGVVRVVGGESVQQVETRCRELTADIESLLGIPLAVAAVD